MSTKIKKKPAGSLPSYGHLHLGRRSDSHRDLTWRRAIKAAEKGGIALSLQVCTAPDAHTPYTYQDWPDVRDVRGALRAAREAVASGRAQYAEVFARAERHYYKNPVDGGRASWDLGGFEVCDEEKSKT